MFDNDFDYFPTLREIRDGLIGSQLNFLNQAEWLWNDRTIFNALKAGYLWQWNYIFKLKNLGSLDKPLTRKILRNPNHPIT